MIPDLDHHCTWLNTCVGSANYGRFLSLASLCASAHGLGAAASVLAALEGGGGGAAPLHAAAAFLSACLCVSSASLLAFHAYLILWLDMTTYDWMLHERKKDVERAKRKAEQQAKVTPA
jgi:palmitoyltransferase